jgi:HNH endonuclease.
MINDYRNSKYCPDLGNVQERKGKIADLIKRDHPYASDMHTYLSKNDDIYKKKFLEAYNYKCAYCGISSTLIPKNSFEIDHFIYKMSPKFSSKKKAGTMENLVLSCHECNHKKNAFLVSDEAYSKLHPDKAYMGKTFCRDGLFYIKVSEKEINNQEIVKFYEQLQLGSEVHRLDYLLLSMIGLQKIHKNNVKFYAEMGKIVDMLRQKRNVL